MTTTQPYHVLARKYRPSVFADLIGQEAMVRTLSNAIATQRIAHAFLLTGIRGVGKTTTARIIARALNCVEGPTITPCGVCDQCIAIREDRHPDILEMDAASRTGVGDIREIIENVRYLPTMARYKIYIIDEVHMLSNNAFNALLKTLEEPPAHVKFIFATTELRKIPITILSRCQRFDLRRVDAARLAEHLGNVANKEGFTVDPSALALIAQAAEGSVRDGLSLLDQAIAHGSENGQVPEETVRDMLGVADRGRLFDLVEELVKGNIAGALAVFKDSYEKGSDPALLLIDLLEISHLLTRLKVLPASAEALAVPEMERQRGRALAEKLNVPYLARMWQMLLKGIQEVKQAPHTYTAAEMILIRLAYASDLPTPEKIIGGMMKGESPARTPLVEARAEPKAYAPEPSMATVTIAPPSVSPVPPAAPVEVSRYKLDSLSDLAALFLEKQEPLLYNYIVEEVHLVSLSEGRLEFRPAQDAPANLAQRFKQCLSEWTGQPWQIIVSRAQGQPTLKQIADAKEAQKKEEVRSDPLVNAALSLFPDAEIIKVASAVTESLIPTQTEELIA